MALEGALRKIEAPMKESENWVFRLSVVVSGENVAGMDATVEPTGTYSWPLAAPMIVIVRPTCSLDS
jgi:hypothetical protein